MKIAHRLAIGGLAIVLSVLLPATVVYAEDATVGFAAGATASMFPPPDRGQTITLSPGLVVGLYAVIPILKSVSFLPELTRNVDALLRELTIVEKAKEWAEP